MDWFLILLFWIVFALVGVVMAKNRGRSPIIWGGLGFLFPPALLVLLALKPAGQN